MQVGFHGSYNCSGTKGLLVSDAFGGAVPRLMNKYTITGLPLTYYVYRQCDSGVSHGELNSTELL